jgi:acyl-CoA thioester hydrolase
VIDPGLTGASDRPIPGIDNGFVAGYRVRFDEAGRDGLIRTSALLRYAQDVAWRHSEALGFDRPWYVARGRWWVVRGVDLEVVAAIAMGQTLRVSTVVVGHRRIWARRLAEARHADGTLAARIVTDWVLLDEVGRLVRIPEEFGLSFTNPVLSGEILRVQLPESGAASLPEAASHPRQDSANVRELRFAVRPQDIDPMGHVNNATYLDWVEESLTTDGPPTAAQGEAHELAMAPRRSRLEYLASATLGDGIVVTTRRQDARWSSRIVRNGDGLELLRGIGILTPEGGESHDPDVARLATRDAQPDEPLLTAIEGVPGGS